MNGRQKTLFQSWWRNINSENKNPNNKLPPESSAAQGNEGNVIDLCDEDLDEDDAVLVQALKESAELCNTTVSELSTSCSSSKHTNTENGEVTPSCQHPHSSLFSKHGFVGVPVTHPSTVHNVSFKDINSALTEDSCTLHDIPDLHYFDRQAGQLWIYPTNYPVRDYQFSIVQQCLYKNTMVTLPTGLGKTFIAAVVMYNFYRWYPQGKVVFMAPTKPLVAQQMEACFRIMGIPQQDTSEMTGTMNPTERRLIWKEKRVFFLTPQVMTNDLSRGTCPAEHVKCLVIDEAHRAMGNHAYCQVVRELVKYSRHFRILALTATPGSDIKAVQQVISNLLVSHIELRTEESIDIKPYTHERKVEKIVVPLGEKLTILKNKYIKVMNLVVQRLTKQRVLCYREPSSLSKFLILKAREAFRQNPPPSLLSQQYGVVEGNFALALSLYHGYELLQLHGLHSLYNFLDGIISGAKGHGRTRTELLKFDDFQEIMDNLRSTFTQDDSMSSSLKKIKYVSSHPKLKKLEEVVLEHFSKIEVGKGETRVMIFSQYRDSVQEIKYLLNMHQPRVKAMSFIGQSSSCKTTKGLTQKEQLKVMKEFREGGYNTLISTCVGEEGLDIGDVDLIICFDAHKSPIRLVQRMGRTGRKRQGRIVMLVTEGKEEQIYNQSQYSKRSIHKAIMNGKRSLHFYQSNPRMLPGGLTPKCHKMYITVPELDKKTPTMGRSIMNQKKPNLCGNYITTERKTAVVVEDGTLTAEEYSELQEYLVPDSQLRHPPHPMAEPLCLDFEVFSDKNSTKEEKITLSLSEWMPWQNRLQEPCFVDNSLRSRHLVELVEFLQLQNSLQDSEDHYGVEMEMFLSYEDVLQPGEEDTSTEGSAILGFGTIFKPQYLGVKEARDKTIKKKNIFDAQLTITEWKGGKGDEDNDNLPEFDVGKCMDDQFEEKENLQKEGRRNMDLKEDRKLVHSVDDKGDFEEDADSDITDDIREDIDNNTCVMEVNVGPGCLPVICTEKLTTNQDLSGNDMNICQMSVKGKSRFSRTFTLEQFEIRTSPMPDEVDDVFSEFGDMKEMPSLDIKHLVSQWYEETHGIPLKAVWLNEQHGPWVSEEITHLNAGQSVDVKAVDGACRGGSVRENHMWNDNNLLQLGVDTNTFTSVRQKTGSEDYISSDSSINIINTQKKDRLCSNRIITNGLSSETQASEIENLKAEYILDNIEEMAAATTNQEHEPISSNSPITFTQALMCVQKNEEHFPHHQQHLDKIVGSVGFNSCLNIGNIFGEIPSFNLLDDTSDFERKGQESGPFDTMNPIHCTNSDSVHCLGNTGAIPLETSDLTHIVTDEHKSFISSENPQEHTTKKTLDQVEEDFDMPYFDLEFDIEDDIIAPSPQKSQTFYQGSFSGSQHTCISHQRLECHFQQKECVIPEDSQVADMSYLHPADYVSELEITQSTTTKSHISSEWRCPHKSLDTRTGNILDFTQSTGQTSECPSSSGVTLSTSSSPTPKTSLLFNLPGSKNWSSTPKQGMSNLTQKRSDMADMARPVTSIDSSKTIAKMKSNWVSSLSSSRVAAAYPVTTDQKEELKTGSTDSEDESFQIIRKRKVIAILEDSSDSFHMQDKTGDRVSPVKTPTGYSIHQKKKAKEPSEASYGEDKHVVTKQASVEKKVFDFLDLEAVLSGSDMSCDGNYSSDEKHLDASFVNDSTQMSELDTIDMQAVYLKSIRSPVCSDHQFHLQPRHFDMDIFSQVPHEDESQYQEDSFCVTEDHKESAYSDEEGDFEELCDDSKRKKNPFKTSFQKSRKRIRHLSVSSSEEGDEAAISVPQDTQTTSQQMTTYSVSQKTQPSQVKLTIQMSNSDEERTSTQMKSKLALQGSKKGSESNRSQIPREHQISITVKTDGSHLTTSPHLQPNTSFSHKENQCQNHQTMRKEGALCTSVNNISCLSAPMMDKCGDITGVSRCKKTIITDFNHQTSKPYFSTLKKSDSGGTNSDKPLLSTRKSKERVVILVDSREISRAQGIMSTLRLKHSFTVAARQLIACDYILSSRLAVDRWNISDFSSGTNQGKLSERIQKMQGLYDRCCVIVEKDQVKPREKKSSRLSYRTKYYDWLLALLVQTSVRLFFTEDEEETAGLLVKLTELEKKKGMNISLPIDLRSDQEQIMKFFRTIPKLCYAHAISLCYNYSSISQFLSSCTPESVSVRGQMTEIRAADVCRYVCHKFDLQMTPTRK